MSFTWIPYYKELAQKLVQYRNNREELLKIVRGLDDEFVIFLRKDKIKENISDIHPFAIYSIFTRRSDRNKKQKILEYFKKSFNLVSNIPEDYDGIPSINPQNSFWGMPWAASAGNKVEANWDLFCTAINPNFNKEDFCKFFDKVLKQEGAKWNVTHALFRMAPDRFLSIDGNSSIYLKHLNIPVFAEKELCGKQYLDYMDTVTQQFETHKIQEKNYYQLSYNSWIYAKENRNYWLIAPGESEDAWSNALKTGTISIGWGWIGDIKEFKNKDEFTSKFNSLFKDKNNPKKSKTRSANDVWRFYKELRENDIVFAKAGVNGIYGTGTVLTDYYYDDSMDEEYAHFHDVEWEFPNYFKYEHGIQKTITKLEKPEGEKIMEAMNKELYKDTIELKDLLKNNHNIILHGAPGTGKTYRAKDIAAQIICGKPYSEIKKDSEDGKKFTEQTGFVQFHPSYDYSDFIEGLRPIEDDKSGEVGFIRKDGIFKEFCATALENLVNSSKTKEDLKKQISIKEAFNNLCSKIQEGSIKEIDLRNEAKMDISGTNDNLTAIYLQTKNSSAKPYTISLNRLTKLSEVFKSTTELDKISNIDKEFRAIIGGCHSSAYWGVLKEIYELKEASQNENEEIPEITPKDFVFIIDEINRGEMSKIFGELFFSLDPDYRGKSGAVRTQYANMIKEQNPFDEYLNTFNYGHFFVPENVYIIGTMNDIDRSVESMDFAMRRRFTFVELKADKCLGMLQDIKNDNGETIIQKDEIIAKMKALNYKLEKEPGLSSAYDIGGSYFTKLEKYKDKSKEAAFNSLWNNHLEPLITDYLRGIPTLKQKVTQLKEVYDNPEQTLQQIQKE